MPAYIASDRKINDVDGEENDLKQNSNLNPSSATIVNEIGYTVYFNFALLWSGYLCYFLLIYCIIECLVYCINGPLEQQQVKKIIILFPVHLTIKH